MTQGNLGTWTKQPGDQIVPGDVLVEIETDKAQMEGECQEEGYLAKILVESDTKDISIRTVRYLERESIGNGKLTAWTVCNNSLLPFWSRTRTILVSLPILNRANRSTMLSRSKSRRRRQKKFQCPHHPSRRLMLQLQKSLSRLRPCRKQVNEL